MHVESERILAPWHQYRRHEGYVGYTSEAALYGVKTAMALQQQAFEK